MRVTCRWMDAHGKNGKVPGKFGTVFDAEEAARKFLEKYPTVVLVAVHHETGWVTDVRRPA